MRITELPEAQPLSGNEQLEVLQNGENRKLPLNALQKALGVQDSAALAALIDERILLNAQQQG